MNSYAGVTLKPGQVAMLLDDQVFAYRTGVRLRAVSLILKSGRWQIVFRGMNGARQWVYCLWVADDLQEGLGVFLETLSNKGGASYWYPDKFT